MAVNVDTVQKADRRSVARLAWCKANSKTSINAINLAMVRQASVLGVLA